MAFNVGDSVEFTEKSGSAEKGDCGRVNHVLNNGRYDIIRTHSPGCVKMPNETPMGGTVPERVLKACNCPD